MDNIMNFMNLKISLEEEFTQARFIEWTGNEGMPKVDCPGGNPSLSKFCDELVSDLRNADVNYGKTGIVTAPVSCETLYNNHASYLTITTIATLAAESCGITTITSPTSMRVSACFAISAPVLYVMKSNTKSANYFIRCVQSNLPAIGKCYSDTQLVYLSKTPRIIPSKLYNYSDRGIKPHQQTTMNTNMAEFRRDLKQLVENRWKESKSRKILNKINKPDNLSNNSSNIIKIIKSYNKEIKNDSSHSTNLVNAGIIPKFNKNEIFPIIPELVKVLEYLKKIATHNKSQQYSRSIIKTKLTDARVGDSCAKIVLKYVDQTLSPIVIFPSKINSDFSRNSTKVYTSHVNKAPKVSLTSFGMYTERNVDVKNTSTIYQPMNNDRTLTDPLTVILNEGKGTAPEKTIANKVNKTVSIQAVASTFISPIKSSQKINIIVSVPNQLSAKVTLAASNSELKKDMEVPESQLSLHSIPIITEVVDSDFVQPRVEEITVDCSTGPEKVQGKKETVQSKNIINRMSTLKPLSKIKSIFMSQQTDRMNENHLANARRSIVCSLRNMTSSLLKNPEPDLVMEERQKEQEKSIYEQEYDKIYNDSREKAFEKAYNDAYKSVVGTLYDKAYNRAYVDAYEPARNDASFDAYSDTYDDVFSDAYDKVYQIACDEAYVNAIKDARDKAFKDVQLYLSKKYKK